MRLSWIEVTDYRSYAALRFEPDPGVNVLVGDNGSGKTSLLEAVGYLASLSSFRRAPDASLIRTDSTGAVIRGEFFQQASGGQEASGIRHQASAGEEKESRVGTTLVEAELPAAGRRRVLLNGKRATSRAAVAATVALVAFLPDDLDLVKRARRLAANTSTISPHNCGQPRVRSKPSTSACSRRETRYCVEMGGWRIRRHSTSWMRRSPRTAVRCWRVVSPPWTSSLPLSSGCTPDSGRPRHVSFRYAAKGLGESLGRHRLRSSPHDSLSPLPTRGALTWREGPPPSAHIATRSRSISTTGTPDESEPGEQRSVALGLRIAAYRVLAERRGTPPVLLLDDVFSELDARRSARLVERLPEGQMFVTSARSEEVPVVGKRWRVAAGKVEPHD